MLQISCTMGEIAHQLQSIHDQLSDMQAAAQAVQTDPQAPWYEIGEETPYMKMYTFNYLLSFHVCGKQ